MGPTAEDIGADGAAQDAADQRASLPILGLTPALGVPMWRWRGAHKGLVVSRGHGIWARWLCMVSRGWVRLFFGWWHHGDGTHAVMVARAVPACILAQADTTN